MAWYIYALIALGIFLVGYFVGANNPTSSVKAKILAAAKGAATSVVNKL